MHALDRYVFGECFAEQPSGSIRIGCDLGLDGGQQFCGNGTNDQARITEHVDQDQVGVLQPDSIEGERCLTANHRIRIEKTVLE